MKNFKTIEQVWKAIDEGINVYWCSDAYQITIEDVNLSWRTQNGFDIPFSTRGTKCLRVTCMSNWFGSLLLESEISQLYIKRNNW